MSDAVTTLLDAVGLLLVAAGVTFGLWTYVGGWAPAVGGVVVLVGTQVSAYLQPGGE